MRLATSAQMRLIEEIASREHEITDKNLMESAGALSALNIHEACADDLASGTTVIVCGRGNNGGDGLVVARHLKALGHRDLAVVIVGSSKPSLLNQTHLREVLNLKIRVLDLTGGFNSIDEALELIKTSSLLIDAIFGIGFKNKIDGTAAQIIECMNQSLVPIISLDTPSGLNVDTGVKSGACIKAAGTLTYGIAKAGLYNADGPEQAGSIKVVEIGLPKTVLSEANTHRLFTRKMANRQIPKREERSNKSNYGHTLILAGSAGFWGAGILAGSSAFRTGCGYVTWASFENPEERLKEVPEMMTRSFEDKDLWKKSFSSIAVGPGLGVNKKTEKLLKSLIQKGQKKVVVDADAITCAVNAKLFPLPKNWVLTPHSGELSRIIGWHVKKIEADRFTAAQEGARIAGCYVLLKGFRTILASPSKRLTVVNSGNSALAKAGTGDVLTGMIAGFMAQGLSSSTAALLGAYIHGRLADSWVKKGNDKRSLTASDLREDLPKLLGHISKKETK